jgi:hypothetical protein
LPTDDYFALERQYRRTMMKKAEATATIQELRRGDPVKPNGHRQTCVCRQCFEEWLETQHNEVNSAE